MFNREPAVIISAIVAFLTQLFALVAVFGVQLDPEVQGVVLRIVEPLVLVIVGVGFIIRRYVWSPASVDELTGTNS